VIRFELPQHPPLADLLEALKAQPKAPVIIEVPEGWCYQIQRGAPPGGWRASLLETLRPGLFPEAMEALHWDEEIGEDGAWRVWAMAQTRLDAALGEFSGPLWSQGRLVRLRPAGQGEEGLAAFPNLAPRGHRARRIPWRRLRRLAQRIGPALLVLLLLGSVGLRLRRNWNRLQAQVRSEELAIQRMDQQVQADRSALAILRGQASRGQQAPIWLSDLDALTRLLPEDTRLVKLEWTPQGLLLDLLTPHPERIQEILEASPEFKGVRFVGNLDRQGELSRLTLQCQSEGER